MYWVFWMVFQNLQTFPGFPDIPGGPALLQMDLEGFWTVWTQLDVTGHHWTLLDVTGCTWRSLDVWQVCLGGSRTFGLRQVLAGQPCRCQVGEAHGGSRIDVVVVRE